MDIGEVIPIEAYPRCVICNMMPVQRFEMFLLGRYVIFLVSCHGAQEMVYLTLNEIEQLEGITFGVAFDPATKQERDPHGR